MQRSQRVSASAGTVTAWAQWLYRSAIVADVPGVAVVSWLTGDKWRSRCFALAELEALGEFAAHQAEAGLNVYLRTTLLAEPVDTYHRGTSDQTGWICAVAGDFDVVNPAHAADNYPPTKRDKR